MSAKGKECFECNKPATEMAHVVPKSRGGTKTIPLCGYCHGLSHDIKRPQDLSTLVKEGMARRKLKGLHCGRPFLMNAQTVEKIINLHKEGKSLNAIARQLNLEAVPTTQSGASWYASTVKNVIDRAKIEVTP